MRRFAVVISIALLTALLVQYLRRRNAPTVPLPATPPAPPAPPAPDFVSVPWTLVEASPTEPRLAIRYVGDERMELDRVDAQETPTQVFVTVLMRQRPAVGGGLPRAQEHEAVVPLAQPLGERELVHTPVDPDAP